MADIGNHGLSCLEDENMAAISLYMQCQAEAIDAALTAQDAQIDSGLQRPTAILYAPISLGWTFPSTGRSNNLTTLYFSNSPIFSVSTIGASTYLNIGSPAGTVNPLTYPTGLWMVGGSARMITTPPIGTPLSPRSMTINVIDDLSVPSGQTLASWTDTTHQVGAEDAVNVKGPVILRGTSGVRVGGSFFGPGLAAGGAVSVQAGAYLWVTYVGPDELVEVV